MNLEIKGLSVRCKLHYILHNALLFISTHILFF